MAITALAMIPKGAAPRIALCGLLAVMGCGSDSGGVNAVVSAALFEAGGRASGDGAAKADTPAPARQPRPTRAQITAANVATIRTRLVDESVRPLLSAQSVNNGVVTYMSAARQAVAMRGALVVSSRGLGFDLLTTEVSVNEDPVITARPLADWPPSVARTYRFPGGSPQGRAAPVVCTWEPGEAETVEIIEVTHTGIQVAETCTGTGPDGDDVSFTNYHLVDPKDGQVWRTIQWLGPRQSAIDVEVVEPFTGD